VLHAEPMTRAQSQQIADNIAKQGGPKHLENKQIIALVAYLQRLGTDIKAAPPVDTTTAAVAAPAAGGTN